MKALVYKDRNLLEVEDVPLPEVGPGQLLIRTELSGICGSDVSMVRGGMAQTGIILGHEPVGVIERVGRDVEGWKTGERVLVMTRRICGTCAYCKTGKTHLCDEKTGELGGGFAEFIASQPSNLVRLPDTLSSERAVLWNPLANAIHAWKLARFDQGNMVLIMGVGPIGLFVLRAAKRSGASKVIVSDPSKMRRDMALRFGADVALDPSDVDILSECRKHSETGPDIVFDCAGGENTLQEASTYVKRGGQVILFGLYMQPTTVIPMLWILKEIDVQAGFGYVDSDIEDTIEMLIGDTVAPDQMTTSTISLDEAPSVFEKLERGEEEIKIVISFVQ